jgi:uncharacterized protein YjlB
MTALSDESLIQVAERALADAEEAFRRDPSPENQRSIERAWSFVGRTRERASSSRAGAGGSPTVETFTFVDDGRIPNSPFPVILYHDVGDAHDAATCEELFAKHGWRGAWRDGIFGFHHFHSTTHEVLGIVRGQADVILGGPEGRRIELAPGDVAVLPAGTGHCNAGSSADLLVVGAYPDGMGWDIRRGDPDEREEVTANISRVPLPAQDPVHGDGGALAELWSTSG